MADVLAYPSDIAPPGWSPDRDPDDPFGGGLKPQPPPTLKTSDDAAPPEFEPLPDLPDEPPEEVLPRPAVQDVGTAGLMSYTLLYPRTIDGVTMRKVIVSPPALWDVQDFIAGRIKTNVELVSRMTGISTLMLGALRWPDVQALLNITTNLLPQFIKDAIEQQGRGS